MRDSKKKTAAQLEGEIAASLANRRGRGASPRSRHRLTAERLIVVESDGEQDTMTWRDFTEANREMPELEDVAGELRSRGRATIGGGAAPLTVVRLVD